MGRKGEVGRKEKVGRKCNEQEIKESEGNIRECLGMERRGRKGKDGKWKKVK